MCSPQSPQRSSTPQKKPFLELVNASLAYGGTPIVEDISLSFYPGESVIITGPSGSGKTTLLKLAAGLIPPDRGELRIHGRPYQEMTREGILSFRGASGFLFQDAALWANRNIRQNLSLPLEVHHPHLTPDQREERIRELIARFHFTDTLANRPHTLSLGEQKLIGFCRAVICRPEYLFLDEPNTFLDYTLLDSVARAIAEIKSAGRTIIAVTHDPRIANIVADRVLILANGRIAADGTPGEIRRKKDPASRGIVENILLTKREGSDTMKGITDETDD